MKNVLLYSLLFFATLSTAQRKFEFGLTAKSGNYTQAINIQEASEYYTTKYHLSSGVSTAVGVYSELSLTRFAAVSAELSYIHAAFVEQKSRTYEAIEGPFRQQDLTDKQSRNFTVRHLSLPLQLQVRVARQGRLTFSAGIAPTFAFSVKQETAPQKLVPIAYLCFVGYYYEEPDIAPAFQWLFTGGLHYRLGNSTSFGLEILASTAPNKFSTYYGSGYTILSEGNPYYMKSLSLAIRHNLLRG